MIVLGVDPGFVCTGFSIVCKKSGRDTVLDYGYLSLPAKESLDHRIGIFYSFFVQKIKQHSVTDIALETPFLGKNVQSFLKLGYLRGILYLLANQNGLTLHEFAPREIKSAITGYGGADKEGVAKILHMLFPQLQQQKKQDVTDAIAIGLCGLWHNKARYSF